MQIKNFLLTGHFVALATATACACVALSFSFALLTVDIRTLTVTVIQSLSVIHWRTTVEHLTVQTSAPAIVSVPLTRTPCTVPYFATTFKEATFL